LTTIAKTASSQLRARSREVVAYHQDRDRPGKPLHLLIPGGLLALVAFISIFATAWSSWISQATPPGQGFRLILVLLIPYFAGLVVFSYGYELYDWPRALRLALIAGAIGLAVVVVFFTIAYVWRVLLAGGAGAAGSKSSGSGGKSKSSSSSSRTRSSGSPVSVKLDLGSLGGWFDRGDEAELTTLGVCPTCGQPLPGGLGSLCPTCPPPK